MSRLPLIGVTVCSSQIGLHAYHISGDKNVRAMASVAKGLPLILSSMADSLAPSDILDGLDGILFTGAPSNIEPFYYSGRANASGAAHDSARPTTLTQPTPWSRRVFVRGPCSGNLYHATPTRQTTPDL